MLDMDWQKQVERKAAPNTGLLRCIIDTVGDLIYVKDMDGVYRGCNKASESFIGLTEAEQIGKTDFDFFDPGMAEEIRDLDRQISRSGKEHCVEEWVSSPNGQRVLLESKKAPFYGADGEVAGIVGISRDITKRKLAEIALEKANVELDAFVHTVSHDLHTPLTSILGYAEIFRDSYQEHLNGQALSFLDEIISSSEKMQALITDLLALATVGQIDSPAVALDVGAVAKKVVCELEERLSRAGVSVEIGELPTLVIPETFLMQILDNLIVNAMKYGCASGGVIKVGCERRDEQMILYVRDHGTGIPDDERDRIYEAFFRGAVGKDVGGTGIGLATVKKIANLCEGDVWVEETPGGGATFCVSVKG